ncbi:MAG TPA: aminofutalosine synthase MqnE [Thermoguttaceae bacterium]|nr:aminofutalosine synthase MqnE [Thermoguttaceae bacterium]
MSEPSRSTELVRIREKVASGKRLTAGDGELLFHPEVDLHTVGELANLVRERKNGDVAYYNINAHLNPTNVCIYRCPLCAYSCDADDPKAYVMTDDEVLARGEEAARSGCTELHIVGGVHPEKKLDWYLNIIRTLHEAYPRLHLKAWTAVEIAWFAERSGGSVEGVLGALVEAGLGSLPGGGAEIFQPEVRQQISPRKIDADTWLDVHRTAHRLGLRSNATMLYGHVESAAHRVDHLIRLRELQDETGGFQAFIPLSFHPEGTQFADLPGPSGLDDLRTMAAGRLILDNFDHVKAYWISLGIGTAQTALAYGADDLDGTVRHEKIHHDAGSTTPELLSVDDLRALIAEAGRRPVERDTLYRRVERSGAEWQASS